MNSPAPSSAAAELSRDRWSFGARARAMLAGVIVAGVLTAAGHALLTEGGYRRFMLAYLVAFAFVLSLSLGGLFFVIMQRLSRAGWSVLLRRFAEALAAAMPAIALLFLPIAVSILSGDGALYPWAGAEFHEHIHEHPHADKGLYLHPWVFVARWALLLAIWSAMGRYLWKLSVRQDATGDHTLTMRAERAAGPLALVLGLTVMVGAWDLLMTLEPTWYSTIFGVYYLSGAVVGGLSLIILMVLGFQRAGVLTRVIAQAHYLDLGRLLLAFLFFWAYIAYSQYMLLWYANLPAATAWLRVRGATTVPGDVNAWSWVAVLLLLGHFLLPFCALMSRHVKGRPELLAAGAAWMLLMHWLDLLWVVMPELGPRLHLGLTEVGLTLALGAGYALAVAGCLSRHSLVPRGDPRLVQSTSHESVY